MSLLKIRELAARAGISRAAVLYYESAGLLVPVGRSQSGYRLYGPKEIERLQSIRAFRDAGIPLQSIKAILANQTDTSLQLLEDRLLELNHEINLLREQQITLARLLAQATLDFPGKLKSKEAWVALMRRAGMSEEDMKRWHSTFETNSPGAHKMFLKSLKLSPAEVAAIQLWSRGQ